MQTQQEVELEAYGYGRDRAAQRIDRREDRGQADENPYAQAVYRRFVLPLAEAIKAEQDKKRGRVDVPVMLPCLTPWRQSLRHSLLCGRHWCISWEPSRITLAY